MPYIAGKFDADQILCQVPPHTLRVDLQARRWKSDNDPDAAITDQNDNGIPIEFVLLGFTPFFGNLGMRSHEEFIRIAYIGVSPTHRLLPKRCVSTSIISGKSSQKSFISYFHTLYNNRINVAEVITTTKFAARSFSNTDPTTGEDKGKVNYNTLEFKDRPADGKEEELTLLYGDLLVRPLAGEDEATVTVRPSREFNMGSGKGKMVREKVSGGLAGLIFDGRGRPFSMSTDPEIRIATLKKWYQFYCHLRQQYR